MKFPSFSSHRHTKQQHPETVTGPSEWAASAAAGSAGGGPTASEQGRGWAGRTEHREMTPAGVLYFPGLPALADTLRHVPGGI